MEPDPNTHTNVKLTEPCLKKTDKLFDNELTNDIAYFQEKLDELNKAVAITEKQLELLKDAVVIYRGL
jgi:hypothetical protein